ncbi:MAG TPA: aminoacyl-tRNA hydrolase [Thermohalobaculum sp.]|nr:aminoacyl-tRNA hydrolase [Thermohalobaculum sp.]
MKLFVGLGNPGAKYAGHRHNIGFMAADAIHRAHGFGPWRGKFQAEIAEGMLGGEKVWLMKPQTWMNLSGQAAGEAMRYLKLAPADIWVFHDELDLAPGKLRVKAGGGHAGHNGLRSLIQHVGPEFNRVRLGIGHPGSRELVTPHVLHDFAREDRAWLAPLLDAVGREAPRLAAGDAAGFMSAVAQAARPPQPQAAEEPADAAQGAGSSDPQGPFARLLAKFTRR